MKIIGVVIDWMLEWGNSPNLRVILDEKPDWGNAIYNFKEIGPSRIRDEPKVFYWTQIGFLVGHYFHDPGNEEGFGGRTFNLKLADGSDVSIKGPWDHGSGATNKYTDLETVGTAYNYLGAKYETYVACEILVEPFHEFLHNHCPEITLTGFLTDHVPGSDGQSVVIRHGIENKKFDTTEWRLEDKDLRFRVGFWERTYERFGHKQTNAKSLILGQNIHMSEKALPNLSEYTYVRPTSE